MNRLATFRTWTIRTLRDSKVGLGLGLVASALAGAPTPLSQLALVGPLVATCAVGAIGGRAAAAVGLVSYVAFVHPGPVAAIAAVALALGVAWGVPKLVDLSLEESEREATAVPDRGASAVVIDCDGFSALDDTYGEGSGLHVFNLLHRALKVETRDNDLVVHSQAQELVLILDGSSPAVAQAVMERVERRFAGWLADAGYECNLSVGLSCAEENEAEIDSLMQSARRPNGDPYLD